MSKIAHVYNDREAKLGDRVIGLCGKDFKIKVALWADLPKDYPICRDCVDTALGALKEADRLIESTRMRIALLKSRFDSLHEALGEDLILDVLAETDLAWQDEMAMRNALKAEKKRLKTACTCVWTSQEVFEVNPECPIHGGEEPPEIEEGAVGIEDVELPPDPPAVTE